MKTATFVRRWATKRGNTAVARYISIKDLSALYEYANSLVKENTFVMLSKRLTLEEEKKYLKDAVSKVKSDKKIHIIVQVNGKFAGSAEVRIGDSRKSHVGEVGISISPDFREEGIGTECLKILVDESKKLGLKLLYLHCFENNERALHTYEKVGFLRAGVVPGMYSYKDNYVGEVTYYLPLT